jgi:hypothetical protein
MNETKMYEATSNIFYLMLLARIFLGSLTGVGCYHITPDMKDNQQRRS